MLPVPTLSHDLFSAFEDAVIGMTIVDVRQRPIRVNRAFCDFLGYSREQLLARTMLDVVHPDDVAEQRRQRSRLLAGEIDSYRVEKRYIHADGHTVWCDFSCALVRDARGEPLHFISQVVDITDRKSAELALKRSEARLREAKALMDIASQIGRLGAWAYDIGSETLTLSAEVRAMMDVKPGDPVSSRNTMQWMAEHDRPRLRAIVDRALADGSPFDVEVQAITTRGRLMWMRILCEPEWDGNGRVRRLQGAIQDITESKQAELSLQRLNESLEERVAERTRQLRQAIEEVEAMAYSIAHDLRAPMTALHGFSRLLQDSLKGLEGRSAHYFERILGNVRYMSDLTDALLSLARLSSVEMNEQPVDLAAMAQDALARLRELEPQRAVHAEIPPTLPATGDPALLQRVMVNLVGNAWKFSRAKAHVCVRVGTRALPDGTNAFYVQDEGEGFDMAHAAKLFGAFHRLHTSEYEGTGIGLALVRKIVARHGGRVWAEAAPGQGATFWFTLGPGD